MKQAGMLWKDLPVVNGIFVLKDLIMVKLRYIRPVFICCFMLLMTCISGCGNAKSEKELATINNTDEKLAQQIKMLNREITLELQYNADVTARLKKRDAAQASRDSLAKRKAEILKEMESE